MVDLVSFSTLLQTDLHPLLKTIPPRPPESLGCPCTLVCETVTKRLSLSRGERLHSSRWLLDARDCSRYTAAAKTCAECTRTRPQNSHIFGFRRFHAHKILVTSRPLFGTHLAPHHDLALRKKQRRFVPYMRRGINPSFFVSICLVCV